MPRKPRNDGTDRRPRSDSALMSLPDERQAEIFDFCDGHRADGLRTIRQLLKDEQGVNVSISTLSNFLNWYSLRSKMSSVASMADDVARILKETPGLDLDDAKIARASQAYFEARAMQENDAETYVRLAGVRKGAAELELKERQADLRQDAIDIQKAAFDQRVREYEEGLQQVRDALKGAVSKGGISPETMAEIEEKAKIL